MSRRTWLQASIEMVWSDGEEGGVRAESGGLGLGMFARQESEQFWSSGVF